MRLPQKSDLYSKWVDLHLHAPSVFMATKTVMQLWRSILPSLDALLIYWSMNVLFSNLFNSLPNDKTMDRSKLKAIADEILNVNEKLKFVSRRLENIVGKGENAGYLHFLLFQQCFQKASFWGLLKVSVLWSTSDENVDLFKQSIAVDIMNSLPNDKIKAQVLIQSICRRQNSMLLKFVLERLKNILGKGENTGNQHFFLFPNCFQRALSSRSLAL